jgi:hypothetical protein
VDLTGEVNDGAVGNNRQLRQRLEAPHPTADPTSDLAPLSPDILQIVHVLLNMHMVGEEGEKRSEGEDGGEQHDLTELNGQLHVLAQHVSHLIHQREVFAGLK